LGFDIHLAFELYHLTFNLDANRVEPPSRGQIKATSFGRGFFIILRANCLVLFFNSFSSIHHLSQSKIKNRKSQIDNQKSISYTRLSSLPISVTVSANFGPSSPPIQNQKSQIDNQKSKMNLSFKAKFLDHLSHSICKLWPICC